MSRSTSKTASTGASISTSHSTLCIAGAGECCSPLGHSLGRSERVNRGRTADERAHRVLSDDAVKLVDAADVVDPHVRAMACNVRVEHDLPLADELFTVRSEEHTSE